MYKLSSFVILLSFLLLGLLSCEQKTTQKDQDAIRTTQKDTSQSSSTAPIREVKNTTGFQVMEDLSAYMSKDSLYISLSDAIANAEEVTRLKLEYQNLQKIPAEVLLLPNLRELYLANNSLAALPDSFTQKLSRLEILDLSGNNFQKFPEALTSLSDLMYLNISRNRISTLPASLGVLSSLRFLDIQHNKFKEFPEAVLEIENLQNLSLSNISLLSLPEDFPRLKTLTQLSIKNCQLATVPIPVLKINTLEKLVLSNNHIDSIPEEVAQLDQLLYLNLSNNQIQDITPVTSLQNLISLDISGNPFSNIPARFFEELKYLKALNLSSTGIQDLSQGIGKLSGLVWLSVSNTKIIELPASIIECKRLQNIDLSNNPNLDYGVALNQLSNLPKLYILRLVNMRGSKELIDLPAELVKLKTLVTLDLKGNRLTSEEDALELIANIQDLEALNLALCGIRKSSTALEKLHTLILLGLDKSMPATEQEKLQATGLEIVDGSEYFDYQFHIKRN